MQTWVPVLAAAISAAAAFVSAWFSRRTARSERLILAENLAARFREPLVQAAFNLESRLYNIIALDFFGLFLGPSNTEEEREYAELSTLYVFGQYFCWVEILRRESECLDPRHAERDHAVIRHLEHVREILCDSRGDRDRAFRLFRGEQRAIGEMMIVPVADPAPGQPRWACRGYADFVGSIQNPELARWFGTLRSGIAELAATGTAGTRRLRLTQRSLVDILDLLDPQSLRIPARFRLRLDPAAPDDSLRRPPEVDTGPRGGVEK